MNIINLVLHLCNKIGLPLKSYKMSKYIYNYLCCQVQWHPSKSHLHTLNQSKKNSPRVLWKKGFSGLIYPTTKIIIYSVHFTPILSHNWVRLCAQQKSHLHTQNFDLRGFFFNTCRDRQIILKNQPQGDLEKKPFWASYIPLLILLFILSILHQYCHIILSS